MHVPKDGRLVSLGAQSYPFIPGRSPHIIVGIASKYIIDMRRLGL